MPAGPTLPFDTVYRPVLPPDAGVGNGEGAEGPAEDRRLWVSCLASYARMRSESPNPPPLPYLDCTHEPLGAAGTLWWNCACLEWTRTQYWTPRYGRRRVDEVPSEVLLCEHATLPEYVGKRGGFGRTCACRQWTKSRRWRIVAKVEERTPASLALMRHSGRGNGCVPSHSLY
jgi:hypothetical protein